MKLLSTAEDNTKTRKTAQKHPEYRIVSLALSPADIAGGKTNCPSATAGCKAACVGGPAVGMASIFPSIMEGRIRKTKYLREDTAGFLRQLVGELETERQHAIGEGRTLAVRLNTFSDIPWESETFGRIPQTFSDCQFYDYTAISGRLGKVPENYALCLSRKETAASIFVSSTMARLDPGEGESAGCGSKLHRVTIGRGRLIRGSP